MGDSYQEAYARALTDPEGFWAEAAEQSTGRGAGIGVLDDRRAPFYRWFAGGGLNTCYNALDRHVDAGRGEQIALIYDSPVTTRSDASPTASFATGSRRSPARWQARRPEGDRVIIYMPMVPEAIVAMLACARLGAVHSVVFGGFAANELAARIDDARPKW